jgi:FtsH-binding integral membrane protein
MQDPRYMSSSQAQSANIDAGLRSYMLGVYNRMTIGMALTGFFAYLTKIMSVSDGMLTPLGAAIYTSPLKWVVMLAPLGMVFWLSAKVQTMKPESARNLFYAFAAIMGVSLSSLLLVFTGESVIRVFFLTAASFSALSIYGYTTKKNLTSFGSFLIMGLVGLILRFLNERYENEIRVSRGDKRIYVGDSDSVLDFGKNKPIECVEVVKNTPIYDLRDKCSINSLDLLCEKESITIKLNIESSIGGTVYLQPRLIIDNIFQESKEPIRKKVRNGLKEIVSLEFRNNIL